MYSVGALQPHKPSILIAFLKLMQLFLRKKINVETHGKHSLGMLWPHVHGLHTSAAEP